MWPQRGEKVRSSREVFQGQEPLLGMVCAGTHPGEGPLEGAPLASPPGPTWPWEVPSFAIPVGGGSEVLKLQSSKLWPRSSVVLSLVLVFPLVLVIPLVLVFVFPLALVFPLVLVSLQFPVL